MSINDSYYKNKTKLKNFHISLLICFVLFFILFILAYSKFIFLYKVVFYVMFLCMFHAFYRCFVLNQHVIEKIKEKKEKGIKPVFDIDIFED